MLNIFKKQKMLQIKVTDLNLRKCIQYTKIHPYPEGIYISQFGNHSHKLQRKTW